MPKNSIINDNQSCKIIDHAKKKEKKSHRVDSPLVAGYMCGQLQRHFYDSQAFQHMWSKLSREIVKFSSPKKSSEEERHNSCSDEISDSRSSCSTSLGFHSTFFRVGIENSWILSLSCVLFRSSHIILLIHVPARRHKNVDSSSPQPYESVLNLFF